MDGLQFKIGNVVKESPKSSWVANNGGVPASKSINEIARDALVGYRDKNEIFMGMLKRKKNGAQ